MKVGGASLICHEQMTFVSSVTFLSLSGTFHQFVSETSDVVLRKLERIRLIVYSVVR